MPISPGEACFHVVMLLGEKQKDETTFGLREICQKAGVEVPSMGCRQFASDGRGFKFKWELHTEFISLTVIGKETCQNSELPDHSDMLPAEWIKEQQALVLTATRLKILNVSKPTNLRKPPSFFSRDLVAASLVCDETAAIWTDMCIDSDGFTNIVLLDGGLGPKRAGRLVQRLLDIETYQTMGLLGLQTAHQTNPEIDKIEEEFQSLLALQEEQGPDPSKDRKLLDSLLNIAARSEKLLSDSRFRFSASNAYAKIVHRRFEELNEHRIQGSQRLSNMLKRRFLPAMETCVSTSERLEDLVNRVQRHAALIRTFIEANRQEQSNQLLKSLDKRGFLQLKLQKTVEALSAIAISYYAIGIFSYTISSAAGVYPAMPSEELQLTSIPIILICATWLTKRRQRMLDRLES